MTSESKIKYCKAIEEKLVVARKRLADLRHDTSHSISESQHDLIKSAVERDIMTQEEVIKGLEEFKEFLGKVEEKSQIEEGAEFSVEFTDSEDKIENAIFAPLSVSLDGVQIITQKSPLGAALQGKKVGESFTYKIVDKDISGIIRRVE